MFFAVGIPFFFLTILGFKLLSPNMKSIGNIAKYTLLALWIIAVSIAISIGVNQATAFAVDGRSIKKEALNLNPTDTLFVKFKFNENFAKNSDEHTDFKIIQDSTATDFIYSNNINFKIMSTDEKSAYLQIEKESKGKSFFEAKKRAEKIQYEYTIQGNYLLLNNYLLTELKDKFRGQEIEITLFLPLGTLLKMDKSTRNHNRTDEDYFSWESENSDAVYKVESDIIKCLNCPNEEENREDFEVNDSVVTTTVTVNGEVVKVKETTNKKGLSISKDGIIIKTK
jgi:hypothetical protein